MNNYCKHYITKFYSLFKNRIFDQDDVALFISLSRDFTPKNSIFRELGDFLAHPKVKDNDTGLVIEVFEEYIQFFDENIDALFSRKADIKTPTFDGIDSLEVIKNELEKIFNVFDVNEVSINIKDENFREFVFCIIFILSQFKLKGKNKKIYEFNVTYGQELKLSISYESINKKNHYADIPLLQLNNIWSGHGKELDLYIARRFYGDQLCAVSYKDDLTIGSDTLKDYKKEDVYPFNPRW